jgi:hypothetical protein
MGMGDSTILVGPAYETGLAYFERKVSVRIMTFEIFIRKLACLSQVILSLSI